MSRKETDVLDEDEVRHPKHTEDGNNEGSANLDLTTIFPHTKIKAQILRDEGVGRISAKAVQLIGACSAIFVRDFAREVVTVASEPRHDDNEDDDTTSSSTSQKASTRDSKHKRKVTKTKTCPNKTKKEVGIDHGPLSTSNVTDHQTRFKIPTKVTLDHVKRCIEKNHENYDFLLDVIRDVSEETASPAYSGVVKKNKRKRKASDTSRSVEKSKDEIDAKPEVQKKVRRKKISRGQYDVVSEDIASGTGGRNKDGEDEVASGLLKKVVAKAQIETSIGDEIIEDDDEYD